MGKVLIIDDAAFMRLSLKTMLQKNGIEVAGEAENGIVGVEKYKELNPDLVTMDITMPDMDGIECLKEIKKLNPNAKIIMISAMGQENKVRDAIMNGALNFIIKPFVEEQAIKAIKQALSM